MKLFYFSRTTAPNPLASRWLVSGVIEASDLADAKARLDAALSKSTDKSDSFAFSDLETTERHESGIISMTTGGV